MKCPCIDPCKQAQQCSASSGLSAQNASEQAAAAAATVAWAARRRQHPPACPALNPWTVLVSRLAVQPCSGAPARHGRVLQLCRRQVRPPSAGGQRQPASLHHPTARQRGHATPVGSSRCRGGACRPGGGGRGAAACAARHGLRPALHARQLLSSAASPAPPPMPAAAAWQGPLVAPLPPSPFASATPAAAVERRSALAGARRSTDPRAVAGLPPLAAMLAAAADRVQTPSPAQAGPAAAAEDLDGGAPFTNSRTPTGAAAAAAPTTPRQQRRPPPQQRQR